MKEGPGIKRWDTRAQVSRLSRWWAEMDAGSRIDTYRMLWRAKCRKQAGDRQLLHRLGCGCPMMTTMMHTAMLMMIVTAIAMIVKPRKRAARQCVQTKGDDAGGGSGGGG